MIAVRKILRRVLVHVFQERLAALVILDRKARDFIIDRFGTSAIGA